jgi:hypothetical protein
MKVSLRKFFTIGDAVSKFGGYYKAVALPMSFLVSFISLACVKKYYSQLVANSQPSSTNEQALKDLQTRFDIFNMFNSFKKVDQIEKDLDKQVNKSELNIVEIYRMID